MAADKKNVNDLIALIERNKFAHGQSSWSNSNSGGVETDNDVEDDDGENEDDDDYSDVRLLIFASEGPFTESLLPMLNQHDLTYVITDVPEEAIDIVIDNPQIRHVLIDLDKPTNPATGMNIFSDLRTLNPGIIIYYCTKSPMSMESRNIQTKGAKLLQKPVLRKVLDQFVAENFLLH